MESDPAMNPARALIQRCSRRSSLYDRVRPRLFDVSLRDGIQNASPEKYTTEYKKQIFHRIMEEECPSSIEIGSLVSPKVLPIMSDSLEMYDYVKHYLETTEPYSATKVYLLIPSFAKLGMALHHGITHFSFITSVSEKFQQKNTRKTLAETKDELGRIRETLAMIPAKSRQKLYVSCVNRCPIIGRIDNDFIVHELLHYHTAYAFDEICLSDTCGTLTYDDFEYVADTILHFGVPASKLSLHLHVNDSNRNEVSQIVRYCLSKRITRFDVSMLTTGGCSVTMSEGNCLPNMTYDLFYELLLKHLDAETQSP